MNPASAAVAPALSRIQQISLDSQPVKIKIVYPVRYIIPFICILFAFLWYVTDLKDAGYVETDAVLTQMQQDVRQIESELEPLQDKIDTLQKASRFKKDVEEFMQSRPALYTVINEIATLLPEDTWFSAFTFNDRGIVLRGSGQDAFKTLESLRASRLFENVAFRGSVSRRVNGEERFSITLQLNTDFANGSDISTLSVKKNGSDTSTPSVKKNGSDISTPSVKKNGSDTSTPSMKKNVLEFLNGK